MPKTQCIAFYVSLKVFTSHKLTSTKMFHLKSKYERILLFWSRTLVGRIRILKYDVLFLVVFVVLIKSRTLA